MKIGFSGPYCTANFGDWAMLVNNMYDLGDHEYTIFTYSSQFPHDVINYYFKDRKIHMCEVKVDSNKTNSKPLNLLDCINACCNKHELVKRIKNLDMLIVSGGGWLNDKWCGRLAHFYRVIIPVLLSKQYCVPVKFMSQGIGPIVETKETMRWFFNYVGQNTIVALRDEFCSSSYLNEISNLRTRYVPDDLCVINRRLLKDKHEIISEPYALFIINEPIENLSQYKEMFVKFCDFLDRSFGYKSIFLSFDLVGYGEDQSIYLNNSVKDSILVNIGNKKYLPISVVNQYINKAQFIVTGRYHAAVLALQCKTPFFVKLDTDFESYAFAKAHGIIDKYLDKISYEDNWFFYNAWEELFNNLSSNLNAMLNCQNKIFSSKAFKKNIDNLEMRRNAYIQDILTN